MKRYTNEEIRAELHHWIRISSNPNTYTMLEQLLADSIKLDTLRGYAQKYMDYYQEHQSWLYWAGKHGVLESGTRMLVWDEVRYAIETGAFPVLPTPGNELLFRKFEKIS